MLKSLPRTFLLLLLPALLLTSGCVNQEPDAVSSSGTVVFNPLEGGFYGIIGDDGSKWDPSNLAEEFAIDGLPVTFRGIPSSDHVTFHMWGQSIELIEVKKAGDPPPVNLEPFRELARNASCADVRNRLFLIDGFLVFWDQQSTCSDAAYTYTLYGRTVAHRVCISHDSIAGPQEQCDNPGPLRNLFEIIVKNLDKSDLGLGPGHTVEPIDF